MNEIDGLMNELERSFLFFYPLLHETLKRVPRLEHTAVLPDSRSAEALTLGMDSNPLSINFVNVVTLNLLASSIQL